MPQINSIQAPAAVVMVRPHRFTPNPETAPDNAFQESAGGSDPRSLAAEAYREVTTAAERLQEEGVRVHLFEDLGERETHDSVFPNNWFSTHPGGYVAVYPMYSPSRRRERRADVLEMLKSQYFVQELIDFSPLEEDGIFLEGTGAMVLDHQARVTYAARSKRANPVAVERFSKHLDFEPVVFDTADPQGRPIYHTNVLMCIATEFVLVGLDSLVTSQRAAEVHSRLSKTGREVLTLSRAQISDFCGNALELTGARGRVLALSQRAHDALTSTQKQLISRSARLLPLSVPTIEMAGGSVRCMLAGIHLVPRVPRTTTCAGASPLKDQA